jgi:hypothetical protein
MKTLHLRARGGSLRAVAIVDDEDYESVAKFTWHLSSNGYVVRNLPKQDAVCGSVLLHRQLMGREPGDGLEVDHRSGDRLDNQRSNLRVTDRAGNAANFRGPYNRPGRTSRYRGVYWSKAAKKWCARAMVRGVHTTIGYFADEHEAGASASAFRREHMPTSEMDRV